MIGNELSSIISYLERDRGINRAVIIQAIESAIQQVARKSLEVSPLLRIEIDNKTLALKAFDQLVVTDDDTGIGFISLRKARTIKKDALPGESVEVEIPPAKLGRIAAQTARQMILQKIREAERKNVYDEYKDRIGDIVSGTIRLVSHRDYLVDLGKTEATLQTKECIPTEEYNVGDRVRAYVHRVQPNATTGPTIMLSRSCPEFLKTLFRLEVAEIADGIVEVMGVARDPGYRSKISVKTLDEKVDPVGACVGLRGARVRNIVRELNGEKIDIVRWHEDIKQYVAQALAPARLESIAVDQEHHTVRVLVTPDQQSLAIGRCGQNVRLTTRLTGWRVEVKKIGQVISFESQRETAIAELAEVLDIPQETATLLVDNGFLTMEGIVEVEDSYLREVTGLDEQTAREIWVAAQAACGVVEEDAGE